jgi:hypothetical protein
MFEKFKKTAAMMLVLFGLKAEADIPIDTELKALNLTADQKAKLEAHFGKEGTKKMMDSMNTEIKAFMENNLDIKAVQDELDAIVKEKDLNAKELESAKQSGAPADDISAKIELLNKAHSEEKEKRIELEATVKKVMDLGEGDKPDVIINQTNAMKVVHSATHLNASNKEWDKFEKRAWNARLRDGSLKATDFNSDGAIPLLQDDIAHFVRENPNALESIFNDFLDLPKEWDRRTGVLDRVADAVIIAGEIVQGRSKGWSPKNKFKIAAEEGRVFRKKIDITFSGYELQEMENTFIRQYNGTDGSHPWKKVFVGFLLAELVKRQMLDDRIAQVNGIYAETPEGDNNPGASVNSQDGLRFLFWYHRDITKKYRAFDLGVPTDVNIVDYVKDLILSIPEIERSEEGLELGLSQAWLDAYRVRAGLVYQMHRSTDQGQAKYDKNHPIDYPNIIFQPLRDMVKTDFMYITKSKNIQIMDYNVSEKGKFTVVQDKRDTNIFADYRLGIRLKFVGTKLVSGDPAEFERQMVWSNNVPIFDKNTTVPVFDDETGIIQFHYANMKVDKGWKTHVSDLEGAPKGSIIRITGNTGMAAAKNVLDAAPFDLTAAFDLSLGGTLTLRVLEDGTFKELKRTTAPEAAVSTDKEFDDDTIDANLGTVFNYVGAADVTIAEILNGVEGKDIKIYGTDADGIDVVIEDVAGKIEVASTATLLDSDDYIQLTLVDGVWYETKRSITE